MIKTAYPADFEIITRVIHGEDMKWKPHDQRQIDDMDSQIEEIVVEGAEE